MRTLQQLLSVFTLIAVVLGLNVQNAFAGGDEIPKDPTAPVMHHISDAHQFHIIGSVYLPLPCIAYSEDGLFMTLSSTFENGKKAYNRYVMYHDELMRIKDASFPMGKIALEEGGHGDAHGSHDAGHTHGSNGEQTLDEHGLHGGQGGHAEQGHEAHTHHGPVVYYGGKAYELESASKVQGMTSWYDFSITKNVFAMMLGLLILFLVFRSVSKAYKKREGQAPKGMQSMMEVIITFMRDQAIAPAIGPRWEKFFPFLMTLFFFILINNLLGLVPFFPGSANVTGNIGVTLVLAFFAFLVTNLNGNKHYWEHVFWMPGVPAFVKLILTPIEVLGLFIKPITLFIRLFANITAGHIMILSLTSLIFIFSDYGQSVGGAVGGGAIAIPFVFAMNFLELFVGFLQAFIFVLLTSLYIGSAVEEHHHEEAHH